MRKNNKYRNNNNYNSQIYSLNYKFDSISSAGKISGTALDLIKKYNELAKEAQGNADYVEAENFRQYAEHYRKIVTEINERKDQRFNNNNNANRMENSSAENSTPSDTVSVDENSVETSKSSGDSVENIVPVRRRTFKVIDINKNTPDNTSEPEVVVTVQKAKRGRPAKNKTPAESAAI